MSKQVRLLRALVAAAATSPSGVCFGGPLRGRPTVSEDLLKTDKLTVLVQASRAERAFAVALDALGQVVEAVARLDLGADVGFACQVINSAAKITVLGLEFRQLHLQLSALEGQVGNEVVKLRVMEFLRKFAELLEPSDKPTGKTKNVHTRSSCAVELLRLMGEGRIPHTVLLEDIALAMLQQEANVIFTDGGNA